MRDIPAADPIRPGTDLAAVLETGREPLAERRGTRPLQDGMAVRCVPRLDR